MSHSLTFCEFIQYIFNFDRIEFHSTVDTKTGDYPFFCEFSQIRSGKAKLC